MTPRRRWFHFSLKSALVMYMVAAPLLWLNFKERQQGEPSVSAPALDRTGGRDSRRMYKISTKSAVGFPWTFQSRSLLGLYYSDEPVSLAEKNLVAGEPTLISNWGLLLLDLVFNLATSVTVALASERLLFRRKRDSGASEK